MIIYHDLPIDIVTHTNITLYNIAKHENFT